MQKLLSWAHNREVGAVGLLHPDRFACRMGQMGQILDTFREGETEILAKNSPLQAAANKFDDIVLPKQRKSLGFYD